VGLQKVRKLKQILFKPRQLPGWWLRFTDSYPAVPTIIAVTGLAWITFSLASVVSAADKTAGQGLLIEALKVAPKSKFLVAPATSLQAAYHSWIPGEIRYMVFSLYGNLYLYLVVPFLLLLEYLFPCKPSQPLIGKGFLQDAIWFVAMVPSKLLILSPVNQCLSSLYNNHLAFLTISPATDWPIYLQVIAALLVGEFFRWLNHFVRHKTLTLWFFHAVHHSQKEMNVFTDDRAHVIDLLVQSLFMFLPFYIFQVPNLYVVAVIGLYMPIHNRFIHANVKINLGWLGWLIASPQFHRVHHSADPTHLDKNFGVYLSIFDRLFGTACLSWDVYPDTGITDLRFPIEDKRRVWQIPGNWLIQTVYPFMQLFEQRLSSRRLSLIRKRVRSRRS
jgi:sterol desaturase/sphingolipid hydroxylase (fatty acid hydroxylase superfamily)